MNLDISFFDEQLYSRMWQFNTEHGEVTSRVYETQSAIRFDDITIQLTQELRPVGHIVIPKKTLNSFATIMDLPSSLPEQQKNANLYFACFLLSPFIQRFNKLASRPIHIEAFNEPNPQEKTHHASFQKAGLRFEFFLYEKYVGVLDVYLQESFLTQNPEWKTLFNDTMFVEEKSVEPEANFIFCQFASDDLEGLISEGCVLCEFKNEFPGLLVLDQTFYIPASLTKQGQLQIGADAGVLTMQEVSQIQQKHHIALDFAEHNFGRETLLALLANHFIDNAFSIAGNANIITANQEIVPIELFAQENDLCMIGRGDL